MVKMTSENSKTFQLTLTEEELRYINDATLDSVDVEAYKARYGSSLVVKIILKLDDAYFETMGDFEGW